MPCDRGGSKAISAVHCEGLHGAWRIRADGCGRGPHVVVPRVAPASARCVGGRAWHRAGCRLRHRRPACASRHSASGSANWWAWNGPIRRAGVPRRSPVRHWCAAPSMRYRSADACFDAAISADVLCHRAVEPSRGACRTGPRAAPRWAARDQHAGLYVAGVRARSPGAQRPPSHRRPARDPCCWRPAFVGCVSATGTACCCRS